MLLRVLNARNQALQSIQRSVVFQIGEFSCIEKDAPARRAGLVANVFLRVILLMFESAVAVRADAGLNLIEGLADSRVSDIE